MDKQRRLSDKIIIAHRKACEDRRLDVAEMLLQSLEMAVSNVGGKGNVEHRESTEILEAAFDLHQKTAKDI